MRYTNLLLFLLLTCKAPGQDNRDLLSAILSTNRLNVQFCFPTNSTLRNYYKTLFNAENTTLINSGTPTNPTNPGTPTNSETPTNFTNPGSPGDQETPGVPGPSINNQEQLLKFLTKNLSVMLGRDFSDNSITASIKVDGCTYTPVNVYDDNALPALVASAGRNATIRTSDLNVSVMVVEGNNFFNNNGVVEETVVGRSPLGGSVMYLFHEATLKSFSFAGQSGSSPLLKKALVFWLTILHEIGHMVTLSNTCGNSDVIDQKNHCKKTTCVMYYENNGVNGSVTYQNTYEAFLAGNWDYLLRVCNDCSSCVISKDY